MSVRIGNMVLGMVQTNTYFIYREGSSQAICVDPADQGEKIYEALARKGFSVAAILLTHGHFDHIMGCPGLVQAAEAAKAGGACAGMGQKEEESCRQAAKAGGACAGMGQKGEESCRQADGAEAAAQPVKIYACAEERELLGDAAKNASSQIGRPFTLEADVYVKDGDVLNIAGLTCRVIATPGHTAGGCCYYFEEAGILISGDTLFHESVGRTDLPTGSMGTLLRSIKEKLFVLPEETKVYPGHGFDTTIGHEKAYNPYCG